MKFTFAAALLFSTCSLFAQINENVTEDGTLYKPKAPKPPVKNYTVADPLPFGQGIKATDIKVLVDSLAGRTFAGRETGELGQRLAADYIAAQFKALGLPAVGDKKTYFQPITLVNESWKDIGLKVDGKDFKNRSDFYVYAAQTPDLPMTALKEVVFLGYGIEDPAYSDYKKADIEGKAVVFFDGEPVGKDGLSLITKTEYRSPWSLDWKKKVRLAKSKGASMVFIVDRNLADNVKKNRKLLSSWGWTPVAADAPDAVTFPCLFITPEVFSALMGKKAEKATEALDELLAGEGFKSMKVKTNTEVHLDKETKRLEGSNVLAFIEGTDEKLKKEYIFVTAHYDHLGEVDSTKIYFGADDNASGTAAVIEIARAFAEAKKQGIGPKRSVVCMLVSGEEKGLLGSQYYTEFPIFPMDKTVVDINIDMVGRVDKEHAKDPNYIYVIGGDRTSYELHQITEEMNSTYTKMALDYKYNAPNEPNNYFGRSDHFNFVMKGVPATFFFNGTHDDYHKTSDTPDKINHEAAAKRAQLAFYTAWEIANRPTRISVDFKPETLKK